ncbi:hypothetical protein Q7P35_004949 [Cladosporium inversicolor]
MKIMGSAPGLEHEHALTDKAHQTDTPSKAATESLLALNSKTDNCDFTTSVTNTLAQIGLSATQSPTQQNDENNNKPTNKSLPVELWMHIFEYVHATKDYARPSVVVVYKSALAFYGDTTRAAVPLPAFEKRTWTHSKALYHIDRTSRAAALKLDMCLRQLEACKAPALAMRNAARIARQLKQGKAPEAAPDYLAIEVSDQPDVLTGYREAGRVIESLAGLKDDVATHSLGLGTAKRIVLLERRNWDTFSMVARAWEMECAIHEFWRRNGIPAGVVEIA